LLVCDCVSSSAELLELYNRDFDSLLNDGYIEYVDASEEECLFIALRAEQLDTSDGKDFTHCEIHPSMMLSISSSLIPYPHHNQAPRVTYANGQSRQGIGMYTSNYNLRYDTFGHVLYYPENPLIDPKGAKLLNNQAMPAGHNVIVAICCYGG
jgi:DNA-directed RNA polymerase II subunit RPB2